MTRFEMAITALLVLVNVNVLLLTGIACCFYRRHNSKPVLADERYFTLAKDGANAPEI